jgi:hypothetical protein
MKTKLFFGLLFLTSSIYVNGQPSKQTSAAQEPKKSVAQSVKEKNTPDNSNAKSIPANKRQDSTYTRPDAKTRFNRYVKSIVGPTALAKRVFTAGLSTARNSPEEWGPGWEGFGRRFASSTGKSAIKNTTIYALGEAFRLDSKFYRSQKRDFGSRLTNALISPVTARDENGKRVFGFPRIAGTYASNIIAAETWYPDRYSYKNGLRSGTISLGTTALFNVVKEFVFK